MDTMDYNMIREEFGDVQKNQKTIIEQNQQIIDIGTQILNEIKRRNNIEEQKLNQQQGLTRR